MDFLRGSVSTRRVYYPSIFNVILDLKERKNTWGCYNRDPLFRILIQKHSSGAIKYISKYPRQFEMEAFALTDIFSVVKLDLCVEKNIWAAKNLAEAAFS